MSLSGSSRSSERLLQPEGQEDDPEDHQRVQVAVRVAGERVALGPGRLREPLLGGQGHDVEVEPPQRGHHHHAEDAGGDDGGGVRLLGRGQAQRDDRLTERDDDDEAVPLGEVRRADVPALGPGDQRRRSRQDERDRPEHRPHRHRRRRTPRSRPGPASGQHAGCQSSGLPGSSPGRSRVATAYSRTNSKVTVR